MGITDKIEVFHKQLKFVELSENVKDDLANFSCLDEEENFEKFQIKGEKDFKSRDRKKFKNHSKEINYFIKEEALKEQEQDLNTTHLLYKGNELIGFISLCTDSIRLEIDEQEEYEIPYANIPAIKIARLAISKNYQHKELGQFLVKYSINLALKIRKYVGVKFITVDCYRHRLTYYKDKLGFTINKNQNPNRCSDSPTSLRLHIDQYLNN
ncbi:acetyltransferase, gnat family [Clostridium botulinum B str. Osaka05]|uniref:Acetyltransferase, gnat family n=1 Tax=Clostridium botulinum B str. Osaka05 TaxID=1407017 RepID=A0A060N362_CLOBO|nr:GNAT family N-acetyltransferase [Clostridium botulinum]BAO04881.1 acetyltransferase, gnat family [Clostridium botulinum B str. Osaka05]